MRDGGSSHFRRPLTAICARRAVQIPRRGRPVAFDHLANAKTGAMPADDVTPEDVLAVLQPIRMENLETARRVLARMRQHGIRLLP